MDKYKALSEEIVKVLQANSDLPFDNLVLAVQTRLFNLANDTKVEVEKNRIKFSDYTNTLPEEYTKPRQGAN